MISKSDIKRSLIVAILISAVFSFTQDFIYFNYKRPYVSSSPADLKKFDDMLYKDVIKYIDEHTKEYSVYESIANILNSYRYPWTWKLKVKTFAIYFFAVFVGCLLVRKKMK